MIKKLFYCSVVLLFVLFLASPASAADYGLTETAGAAGLTGFGTSLPGLVGNIIGTGLSLVGVLFFALMLYGGVMWMTARGNTENEKKALDTITAAIVGILIVLGSYALTSFVFNNLMSGDTGITEKDPKKEQVDCNGKKSAGVVGCDTCAAAFPGASCTADVACEGGFETNYCNAAGQTTMKCCKSVCTKLNSTACNLNKNCLPTHDEKTAAFLACVPK